MAKPWERPTETQLTGFDPEGDGYDDATAQKYGMTATINPDDGLPHMGSVAEVSQDKYLMLKGRNHKTWNLAVEAEEARGFRVVKEADGRYYSVRSKPWEKSGVETKTPPKYNGLDLISDDKRHNNFFIDRAKAMWDSMPNWVEIPKAVARDTEGTLGSIAGLVKMAGDLIKPNDDIRSQYENNGMDNKRIAFADAVGDWLIEIGSTAKDFWEEESMKGWEAPKEEVFEGTFLENPSWIRAFSLGAGALPSMGSAVIASIATGNPLTGAMFLGLLEGEPIYDEAREAGLSEEDAMRLFTIGSTVITATEYLPMERFMKGGSGKLVKDIIAGFFIEGSQEGVQQFSSNLIRKIGIDNTVSLLEGVVESVIAGGFSGAGMGGATSVLLNRGVKKRIEKVERQAEKLGLTPEEVDGMISIVGDAIVEKSEELEEVVKKHRDEVLKRRKEARQVKEEDNIVRDKNGEPVTLGMEASLQEEAQKYRDVEEFKARGFDAILKALRGVERDTEVIVPTEDIDVIWKDDYDNAQETAREEYDPETAPPVELIYDIKTGRYKLDDGHNRLVSAQRNNQPIKGVITKIDGNLEELAELYEKETGVSLGDIWEQASLAKEAVKYDSSKEFVEAMMKQYGANVLFHGSSEGKFDGEFRSGMDNVSVWTTNDPRIAQNYIPTTGSSMTFMFPDNYQMDEDISPTDYSDEILEFFGGRDSIFADVEYRNPDKGNMRGNLSSWRTKKSITHRQVVEKLQSMGYEQGDSLKLYEGKVVPKDFAQESDLFIFEGKENLKLKDLRTGDTAIDASGVTDYNKFDEIEKAKEEGYDGVIINDYAQSESMGNVGHTSYGIFESGLKKLKKQKVTAKNFDDWMSGKKTTPEVEKFMEGKRQQLEDIWNRANEAKGDTSFQFGANLLEDTKPDEKGKTALQKRLEEIQDAKLRREQAEVAKKAIITAMQEFKNRITTEKKDDVKIPTYFKSNKKYGISLDEAVDEFNNLFGTDLTENEFVDWMIDINNERKALDAIIEEAKEITKKMMREETALKKIIKAKEVGIKLGASEQRKLTQQEQDKIIKALDQSKLTANDKYKFVKSLKNVQDLATIKERIARLESAQVVRETREKIKKQLKTTKPTKQGAIRKGKYDYESNKLFDSLREYSKLTQDQAQEALDTFPEEEVTEADLIRKRFLSLQANGSEASVALVKSVLADIKRMKALGKEAKEEADFIKKLNHTDRVIEVRKGIGNVKGSDKAGIRTKIVNWYRKGFSDIYAMLNSTIGKSLAEEYDPVLAELAKETAINRRTIETSKKIAEALGIEKSKFAHTFNEMMQEEYTITREDESGEVTLPINKWDIVDIYNAIKNKKTKENYYRVYDQEQVDALVSKLTDKERALGDYMQEEVQRNYEIHNERNVELTGLDLGRVENYWMATSKIPLSLQEGMRIQGETPSSRKQRAKGGVIPIPKNAYLKFQKSNVEAEHEKHLSRAYERLKRTFSDAGVQADFEKKFGKDVYKVLMNQIDNLSLNQTQANMDAVVGLIGKGLNNWVVAKIALNPSVFVKQLISVGNYMEVMPPAQWSKHFVKGVMSPKKTFDFMWKNIPDLEARFNRGYSEALAHVMAESGRMGSKKQAWVNGMTFLVRTGDIGAIIYGGYPVIQAHLEAHPNDMKGAIEKFNLATQKAQQSGLKSARSQFQNSNNPLARLFLAFRNTSNQYFRKQVDATISFYQGDISASQYAKTMAIYAVIQPALYGAVGFYMRSLLYGSNDEEDQVFSAILESIALSPFNAIPLINDVVKTAIKAMQGEKIWKALSMPMFDDINYAFTKMTGKDVELGDVMYELASLGAEVTTGTPVKTYEKIFKRIFGEGESSGW